MKNRQDKRNKLPAIILSFALGSAAAAAPFAKVAAAGMAVGVKAGGLPHVSADSDTFKNILTVAFGIIGAFALLSMTTSGLKYITSGGDPQKTSEAKKGIIFALVGLMIAVSAEAIVAFVVNNGAPGP